MKIGIIGAGNVGTGLGRRLAARGHDIVVSFSRSNEKLAEAVALIGGQARAGSPTEAVAHGDVVIVATPWAVTLEAVTREADRLVGKIVWDTTNPLAPNLSELTIGTTTSAGEELSHALPGAIVVKAVPPFAQLLHSDSMLIGGHRPGVFVCGDDPPARATILSLLEEIEVDPVNAGPLKLARLTEPLGLLVTHLAYVQRFGPRIGAVLVRDL